MNWKQPIQIVALSTVCGGLLIGSLPGLADWIAAPAAASVQTERGTGISPPSFADIVEAVSPAVVTIDTTTKAAVHPLSGSRRTPPGSMPRGFGRSPLEQFFGSQGLEPQTPVPTQALGSGFIFDSDGYIVTNHHVIAGADTITVTFQDGSSHDAVLIGDDEKTDLALLKVESKQPLPSVAMGDSKHMRVGDWVLAIGNPFGLGGSATVGIISAKGRDIRSGPYDNYLQIDAPINSGNSGGPVFNDHGEVIGVNTAIFSPNGGNVGIGFAIPAEQVEKVVSELKQQGHVTRGWLGVQIQSMDDELAKSLGLPSNKGALIAEVAPDSPAAEAGLRAGDVITQFNGEATDSPKELSLQVANTNPRDKVAVALWRNHQEKQLSIRIGSNTADESIAQTQGAAASQEKALDEAGIALLPLDADIRQQLGLNNDAKGVVVAQVEPGSIASNKGIRPGDVIVAVDGTDTPSAATVAAALEATKSSGNNARLLIRRGTSQYFVALGLA